MLREPDLNYQTPPGFKDEYYLYLFDAGANGLVAGNNYLDLSIPINTGGDFVVRKVDGWNTIFQDLPLPAAPGRLWLKDEDGNPITSDPWSFTNPPPVALIPKIPNGSIPMVPERMYRAFSMLPFDLYNVNPAIFGIAGCGADFNVASQLSFQGVKRTPGRAPDSSYSYRLSPYAYVMNIAFDWGLTPIAPGVNQDVNSPRHFYVRILDDDFELWGISANPYLPVFLNTSVHARMLLFDAEDKQRSNIPVLVDLAAYQVYTTAAGFDAQRPLSCSLASAIVPPILYPRGTQIRLDLWSEYFTTDAFFPYTVEFTFFGARRRPI